MPKPTFFQTVLRQSLRGSYASPQYASPWADHHFEPEQEEEEEEPHARPSSRYSAWINESGYVGFRQEDGPSEAGPSQPRRAKSAVSVASDGQVVSMTTRFSKPARKVASSVSLRDGSRMMMGGDDEDAASSKSPRKKKKTSGNAVAAGANSSVMSSRGTSRAPSAAGSASVADRQKHRYPKDTESESSISSDRVSDRSTSRPSSLRPPSRSFQTGSSSSAASSIIPPVSPRAGPSPSQERLQARPVASAIQKTVASGKAPLRPPNSIMSSPNSSGTSQDRIPGPVTATPFPAQSLSRTIPPPKERAEPSGRSKEIVRKAGGKRVSVVQEESEDGKDVFHTTQGSPETPRFSAIAQNPPIIPAPRATSSHIDPPTLSFQPPTPAPIADPDTTPFHSDPSSSNSLSFYPSRLPPAPPYPVLDSIPPLMSPSEFTGDSDAHSASGEVGSDEEEESERNGGGEIAQRGRHSQQTSFSGRHSDSRSRDHSRPSSVVNPSQHSSIDGRISLSRQSTTKKASRKSFSEFSMQRRNSLVLSEASFGGRSAKSAKEGSVRSSGSGFGKGGWAAAAASGSARSGATSPVTMYMPEAGNDGWADFQPPPRQSRFTPLPAASLPMAFDRLVLGKPAFTHGTADRARLQVPSASGRSSPSRYSQTSDEEEEDDLPKPSRSYAKPDADTSSSGPSVHSVTLPRAHLLGQYQVRAVRSTSTASEVPPIPPPKHPSRRLSIPEPEVEITLPRPQYQAFPSSNYGRADSFYSETNPAPRHYDGMVSRSTDPSEDQCCRSNSPVPEPSLVLTHPDSPYSTRPTSPATTRPTTPTARKGFDHPSILNPDVLTILPEMTLEDSARTYRPSPSDTVRPKTPSSVRRSNSLWGGISRYARSEIEREEEDDEVPDMRRRTQSAAGHRVSGSKWGGSSYGEGVLMQSDGIPESTRGYT